MQETWERVSNRFSFRRSGKGDERILLVHGWMASGRIWDRVLPLLDGYRSYVPDLYGSGRSISIGNAVTLDDYVNDLAALCEMHGLDDIHLVGHSMGGQIATLLAARQPDRFRTLTLLNPVPVDGLSLPEELQPLFRNCGGSAESLERIIDMACLKLDAEGRALMLDDALRIPPTLISTGFEAWRRGCKDISLDDLAMPTTVIATDDPFLPATFLEQAVVARLPRARLEYLSGAGHYPQMELPASTAARLRHAFQ